MDMKIFRYRLTDSTSERAREYARSGGSLPALFIAEGQSAGRGRRGRSFDSKAGAGLYMTLLFAPGGGDPVLITIRAAVALVRAIKKTSGLDARIKWVNDLTVGDKKLAGILAEGDFSPDGTLSYCALGVGVNLLEREFPEEISDVATTLEGETGHRILPDVLAEAFVSEFLSDESEGEVLSAYRRSSSVIGQSVEVRRISGESFFARVLDICDSGALSVIREDGVREVLISAEVSIRKR